MRSSNKDADLKCPPCMRMSKPVGNFHCCSLHNQTVVESSVLQLRRTKMQRLLSVYTSCLKQSGIFPKKKNKND